MSNAYIKSFFFILIIFLIDSYRWGMGMPAPDHSGDQVKALQPVIKRADRLFSDLHFIEALPLYQSVTDDYPFRDAEYFRLINRIAECYIWQHEGFSAERIIRDNIPPALQMLGPNHPQVGDLYLNLAVVGFISSATAMTEEYFQKALQISLANYSQLHPNTAGIYEWLGTYHESINDRYPAYDYLNRARTIRVKLRGPDNPEMGNVFRYLALYHKRYARHDSSMFYLKKALTAFDARYGKYNFQSVKCINNMCKILEEAGKLHEASEFYKEALDRISKTRGEIRMATVMTWFNYSDYYARQNEYINALRMIQRTYFSLFQGYRDSSFIHNPLNIANAQNNYLRLVYEFKSNYLKKASEQYPERRAVYLAAALQCDSLSSAYFFRQRIRIVNDEDLLLYEQMNSNDYYRFAKGALEMFSVDPQYKYISAALSYLERYRNMQEIIRIRDQARPLPGQNNLAGKAEIVRLQNQIHELKGKVSGSPSDAAKKELTRQIIDKKIALDQSFYYSFLHRTNRDSASQHDIQIDIHLVQSMLANQEMIYYITEFFADYYTTPSEFILMVITKDTFKWKLLDSSELYSYMMEFTESVKSPLTPVRDIDSLGKIVYDSMFAPFENHLAGKTKLIFVPSPDSWMLPIEAIPLDFKGNRSRNNYLISRFTTHKVFSLTSWLKYQPVKIPRKARLLAVAPKFNSTLKNQLSLITRRDTAMIDLPGARKECEKISTIFPSELLEGYDATKKNFMVLAPQFDIIHLSTHGIPVRDNAQLMTLAFNDTTGNNSLAGNLSLYEILNLRLKSQLVVLSACKSALGEKNKSEGSLNLAWAFRNAGSQSVIVSIWDANDYSSSVIMPRFYRYLAEGDPKPLALRKAKLDFIDQSDRILIHPYYWAGFDFMGNGSPVADKRASMPFSKYALPALILGSLIIFVLLFLRRNR